MKARVAKSLRNPWLRISASLLILGLLLAFLPLHKLEEALRRIPLWLWLWILVGYLVTHVLGVVKWRLTLHLSNAQLTFAQALRCYYRRIVRHRVPALGGRRRRRADGSGFSHRTQPRRRPAGQPGGPTARHHLAGRSRWNWRPAYPGALDPRNRRAFIGLAVVFALAFAGLFVLLRVTPWQRLPFKVRRLLVKVRRAARSMASQPQYVLVSLLLGIIIQTNLVVLSAAIASACGLHI